MIKKLEADFLQNDERGLICQIFSKPINQVNYLFTKKGSKRGRHYNKENREIFYVISGSVKLNSFAVGMQNKPESHSFKTGCLFAVEPYTMHSFTFLEDTQMIVMYDKGVENSDGKDIYVE